MSSTSLVFVYGSLKYGYRLHGLLSDQTALGPASTAPWYRLYDLGEYPGLVQVEGLAKTGSYASESDPIKCELAESNTQQHVVANSRGVSILGEVYEVTQTCLQQLDDAEGVDEHLYQRRQIALTGSFENSIVHAWFYLRSLSGCRDCGRSWP